MVNHYRESWVLHKRWFLDEKKTKLETDCLCVFEARVEVVCIIKKNSQLSVSVIPRPGWLPKKGNPIISLKRNILPLLHLPRRHHWKTCYVNWTLGQRTVGWRLRFRRTPSIMSGKFYDCANPRQNSDAREAKMTFISTRRNSRNSFLDDTRKSTEAKKKPEANVVTRYRTAPSTAPLSTTTECRNSDSLSITGI